jgi:hypothetical protein
MMPKTQTPHLNVETRNGVDSYYFRRGHGPRTRIDHPYGSQAFWSAYQSLMSGQMITVDIGDVEQDIIKRRFPRRIENMLVQCRQRAIANRREFDLTLEWLNHQFEHQNYCCALTGIPFQAGRAGGTRMNPYAPSLDRIDCARGYTRDNVRVVLASINVALNDFGLSHFDQIAAARLQQIVKERHMT